MIECPECGEGVRGTRCKCGWVVPQAKLLRQDGHPMQGCCDWVGDGQCHYPGTFKHGDRWLCKHHDKCDDPVTGAAIVEQSKIDIPRPDYSPRSMHAATLRKVEREIEEWNNRFKEKEAA